MKKFVALAILISLLTANIPCYAEEPDIQKNMVKVEVMLQNRTFLNPVGSAKIQQYSDSLPYEYKMMLYNKYEKNAGLGFGLNFLLISVGSWAIGDTTSAIVQDIIFLAAIALMSSKNTQSVGIGLGLGNWVGSLISPFVFSGDWNNKLKNSLNLVAYDEYNRPRYVFDENNTPNTVQFNILSIGF